jgi:hypothetical protein
VRLGSEVHDDLRSLDQRSRDHRIRDVAAHEGVARVIDQVVQILEPAAVGQLVERRDPPVEWAASA